MSVYFLDSVIFSVNISFLYVYKMQHTVYSVIEASEKHKL